MKDSKYLSVTLFVSLCLFVISFVSCKSNNLNKAEKTKEIIAPSKTDSALELANEYREKGDIDKAIAVLQEAAKNNDKAWPEMTVLSECYIQKKEYALAEDMLKRAMEIESNPQYISHIYRAYGQLYLELKEFQKASGYLEKAIKFADTPFKKADAYFHLAKLNYEQKRIDLALENIKNAIKLVPDNINFNNLLKQIEGEKSKGSN